MRAALQHRARNLAALLPPLLIEAERVAASVNPGTHGRRRTGTGESFWQFRRYAPGDPATSIDWRPSARTDKLFIREREWEAAQSVYLWADGSGSMRYRSQGDLPTKAERAQVLMLALADLLLRGGEKPIWLNQEAIPLNGKQSLERLAAHIDFGKEGANTPPELPLARHAHMVLCGDFLMQEGALRQLMQGYAARRLRGVLVHILDPAEDNFPFAGRIKIQGCENETPLLVPNAESVRDAYCRKMEGHKAALARYAQNAGWFYLRHLTSQPPEGALLQLFHSLSMGRVR